MAPGYQMDENSFNKHNALSGDEMVADIESVDPEADQVLKEKIEAKLWGHTEVNVTNVSVHVKNGFVSLTGEVDGPDAKALLEGLVRSIGGVLDVVSFLDIHDPLNQD